MACDGSSCANFFPLFRSSSIFLFLRSHINLRCKGKIRCCFTRRVVFPYLVSHANVCSHTSPCLPVKHNISFSCFLLRTVDGCFYTLSISSSTTVTLNLPVILFQAKEFEMAMRCLHEIHCKSVRNLRPQYAPVIVICPVSVTIICSHAPHHAPKR